jgi:hypothetical protein
VHIDLTGESESARLIPRKNKLQTYLYHWCMFEVVLIKGRVNWQWRVCDRQCTTILNGWERTRAEAEYQAERGLLLLLMVSAPV